MRCLLLLSVLLICEPASAQWLPHTTKTRRVCALNGKYDYEISRRSEPVSRLTFPGVLDLEPSRPVSSGANNVAGAVERVRVYPLREKHLVNGHCRISKVVVTVADSGRWSLDLMAEQDPQIVDQSQRAKYALFAQNRFHITLRPLTADAGLSPGAADAVAAPALAAIPVEPFWLERGKSKLVHEEGLDSRLAKRFDSVRVIAVDLQYE